MDKNKIKSFAIWARRSLIAAVSEKANRIGVYEDKIEEAIVVQGGFKLEGKDEIFSLSNSHRDALKNQVKEKGFEQVMEEVAYTWFNRFMGLRYMEVNDYLPTGVRILSSEVEGKKEPDVLTKVSEIIDELELNANEIYDLLDTGNTIDREKAYRIILVKQCNELGKIIPQMFEKISDYTELLLPDKLLEEGSVIRKMVEYIEESDWKEEVEIIGWMYQYYISEKKDEVFAALKKNVKITKENIPAATQLFTPKWIVKYMVENSLGKLWLEGHPNEELQKEWKYYLEEAQQEPEVEEELKKIREEHSLLSPEDMKVLDPCMGSGHILVYAFDVLYEIYKTAGYSEREIPRIILQNNLYGLDIDDRAAQLASFALIMKARHYNRRLFREIEREHLELNLCSIQESNLISGQLTKDNGHLKEITNYFCTVNGGLNEQLKNDFQYLVDVFTDAKEYGSILEVETVDFEALKQRLREIEEDDDLRFGDYRKMLLDRVPMLIKQGEIMSRKYEVCITNPPYLGRKGMTDNLKKYIEKKYANSKSDLYSIFIKRVNNFVLKNKFTALITQHSWMFLTSFTKLRQYFVNNYYIVSMIHLGARAFEEIGGEVVQTASFISRKRQNKNFMAQYIRLVDCNGNSKEKEFINKNNMHLTSFDKLKHVTDNIIAYWAEDNILKLFEKEKKVIEYAYPKQGLATGDNDRYLRFWHEVSIKKIGYGINDAEECNKNLIKWVPCNKGGTSKKWYGNNWYIVNWEDNGSDMKALKGSVIRNEQFYFKEGLSWSTLSTNALAMRFCKKGFIFETKGSMCFPINKDNIYYLLGYFNTKLINYILNMVSPTLDYHEGPIGKLPIIMVNDKNIDELVESSIIISKNDWDSFETSWDFKVHPLLKLLDNGENYKISSVFNIWETECEENFNQLKSNEEELNTIFIDIYGLQDELTPEVEDKDITIRKADRERDIKSLISYAVGCMFGRYSPEASFVIEKRDDGYHGIYSDKIKNSGLIYAGEEWEDKWTIDDGQLKVRKITKDEDGNVVEDTWIDAHFMPDRDNIIPITEDEYFEDDIVSRFIDFVKLYFGNDTLEENLDFIADSIGRKSSETARQAIRRYFIKDFYKDHLKVYQKRPIYWMFESGKNDGFKALIYMHRYNEQTVAKVRTDYLHILQRKYESEINRLQLVVDSEEYTAKDRTAAKKKIARISKQLEECKEYDQVVAHFANEKISIDLDDGVKVNYAKFQGVTVINSKEKEVKMNLLAKI
ncbi:BREX-1 system adenine-specific DNA-methyltransferase PglX [Clostridium botulinum]|nr:BREX-1 system adenine-specific DNA-methyltransferase PglX [Clostridium botulinum]NFO92696.1 BREX-1 system adenine-specific DNA-methyltransferase PglX [Clostridium botulinum]